MKKLLLMILLCVATQTQALELAGVKVDEKVQLDTQQLQLSGSGIRSKFFIKVYVAGLYLSEKLHTSAAILADNGAKRMSFHMLREVSGKKMLEAINDAIPPNHTAEEMKALDARLAEFAKIFAAVDEVKKGDVITFDYFPGMGTRISIAGVEKGRIEGADFNRALLKVWLGEKPAQADLKQSLLGKE
jgi:hypothetical protein